MGIRAVVLLIAAAAALVVGGILLGDYFDTPEEASLRQPPVVVPVTDPLRAEPLERTLTFRGRLEPTRRSSPRFAAAIEGRVITALGVAPGDVLISGVAVVELEGRPVIALTGAFPTWRDFSASMTPGPDVVQLQRALAELGFYDDNIDGHFGPRTLRAATRLFRSIGYLPQSKSAIRHDELVFIPADLRRIERLHMRVGDLFRADMVILAASTKRIEADLAIDQQSALRPGLTIRSTSVSGQEPWTSTILEIVSIDREDGAVGANSAIVPRGPTLDTVTGEQVFEVEVASTNGSVLSASPAAVHASSQGDAFVVVLEGGEESIVSVTVGLVTEDRVEVTPRVSGALEPGDLLVLNPADE